MGKVFSVRIKWIDDGSEYDVLIYEFHDASNLPGKYTDDDIFFYGMSKRNIEHAIESGEPCENEWVILKYYGEI